MRELGRVLVLFGVISAILKLLKLGVTLLFLYWVDNWGSDIGWAIRIGFILVGGGLIALSYRKPKA
jgi:hypothetical protein